MEQKRKDMPVGLAMSFGMHPEAMESFAAMTEEKQNEVIDYVENAVTGDEARCRIEKVTQDLSCHSGGGLF